MSKIIFVFCEDDCQTEILRKIIKDTSFSTITDIRWIKTRGVRGQNAFVEGYLSRGGATASDLNIVFRDRDFDFPIPSLPTLQVEEKENKIICTSYRVTAENYLISAEKITAFFNSIGKEITCDFEEILQRSALEIAHYTAARHTLASFRANFSFRTTWTDGSGKIPRDLTTDFCFDKSWSLVQEKQSKLCPISKNAFGEKFEYFIALFDTTFFESNQYLVWFSAKDLETQFCKNLPTDQRFSIDAFYRFALNQFNYLDFEDLVQFRDKLSSL